MLIYLNLCCLNRPFDDQTQPRIKLEAEAVHFILQSTSALQPAHQLCGSHALEIENGQTPNEFRRNSVAAVLKQVSVRVPHDDSLDQRAVELNRLGFQSFDAYHLAAAEAGGCDRLATCDDQFLKAAKRNSAKLKVIVLNPIDLVDEAGF
ncbi:MAG: PIN domain-containing protein [Gemmataceae bacterium]|nr:PIN domain-containing protein [Gemmataceae bacterium]